MKLNLSWPILVVALLIAPVVQASSLNVSYPYNDASVNGAIVVTAQGSSDLWWTQLQADGLDVGTAGPSAQFLWNTTSVGNGWHTLVVKGFAEWANSPSVSTTVNVYVDNTGGGLWFATQWPHSPLPSEYWCAAVIPWSAEKIPQNTTANYTTPTASQIANFQAGMPSGYIPASYYDQVDGNYSGSTDMIIRWAACKWGIDENLARAAVWGESGGYQSTAEDWTTNFSLCPPGGDVSGNQCAATYGISQIRYSNLHSTWPMSWTSTAFNVDYRFMQWRACMDGQIGWYYGQTPASGYPYYPNGSSNQMNWGCIQSWYSGAWYDAGSIWYIGYIQGELADQKWLN